jgi:hypothetical protein
VLTEVQLNQQDCVTQSSCTVVRTECAKEDGGSVIVDRSEPSNPMVLLCLTVKGNKHPSAFFNHGITCKSGLMALRLVKNHGINFTAQR